jgi:hypothetical protein
LPSSASVYALFPNMTVRRNVEYAIGRNAKPDDVTRLLQLAALEGLGDAYPEGSDSGSRSSPRNNSPCRTGLCNRSLCFRETKFDEQRIWPKNSGRDSNSHF